MTAPDAGAYPRRRPKVSYGASAVVTGAGSGIGRAFAEAIVARGGRVVCADINLASAQETADKLGTDNAHAVGCDVSSYDEIVTLADTATSWLRQAPDLVINNAGIGTGGKPIGEVSMDDWNATIGINMWGMIYGCQVFTPRLREQGFGGIINVSSAASFAAAPLMGPYNVSKAAVLALSETLRAELAGTGVRVTVLCPTAVKTNILDGARIPGSLSNLASTAFKWVGVSPEWIAKTTLNAHDRGRLYVVPQPDAKLIWAMKRHAPVPYSWGAGIISRLGRLLPEDTDPRELWDTAYEQESPVKVVRR
ncbi:SDR family NAD(P)-dependent oxidoreductase [Mycobacteroides salmoniphilum]|uniref:Oxidoreductase n=1 Tax=Mycobacteroides salmoniphilum TaxID=404941 RepID=A0A4R8SGT0_9MYCO|nr:SDR family NAD(P)-dependent oxidoreductase [Mycobacteroides salmoniphilum]TDZ96019.1 putative oxidoreductase [Mycobacteroides salmoniphilum]TEA05116.1 putative oxidoreductase [Mycobacteroides salmoniphilum]